MAYIHLQPFSKPGPAWAKGRPCGHGVAGVVRNRPSQIPSRAPSAELMKITDVHLARLRRGATSPT